MSFLSGFSKQSAAHKDLIPGGLADSKEPKDFDQKKLKAGVKVEKEHTSSPAIAKEIAMDHLSEDSKYYKKLKLVEKKAGARLYTRAAPFKYWDELDKYEHIMNLEETHNKDLPLRHEKKLLRAKDKDGFVALFHRYAKKSD